VQQILRQRALRIHQDEHGCSKLTVSAMLRNSLATKRNRDSNLFRGIQYAILTTHVSIANDFGHTRQLVAGLALCELGHLLPGAAVVQ
jgi:hypothetical protein